MKKLPPYARQARVPADNPTMYVFYGWFSREQANNITQSRGMVLPVNECPTQYAWPVKGCGVILMDYLDMPETDAMVLATVLRDAGSESVIWANFKKDSTHFLIKG